MTDNLPPVKIAFIIDNTVVDILHTDERLGAIMLSEPLIMDVSERDLEKEEIAPFSTYDPETGTFTLPKE
jgi:hypothetical protein